jgi:hypothetical protein
LIVAGAQAIGGLMDLLVGGQQLDQLAGADRQRGGGWRQIALLLIKRIKSHRHRQVVTASLGRYRQATALAQAVKPSRIGNAALLTG